MTQGQAESIEGAILIAGALIARSIEPSLVADAWLLSGIAISLGLGRKLGTWLANRRKTEQ